MASLKIKDIFDFIHPVLSEAIQDQDVDVVKISLNALVKFQRNENSKVWGNLI